MPQVRVIAGLMIAAIGAVYASVDSLQLASQSQPDPWGVESAGQRFSGAAQSLATQETVGYLSDLPVSDDAGMAAFRAAQYALAPHLLTPIGPTGPQQAVGNFAKPTDYAAFGAKSGYSMVADLGNGVVLYKKTNR
jgi:hypothetical protein